MKTAQLSLGQSWQATQSRLQQSRPGKSLTIGDIFHGAIGAAIASGVVRGAGRVLGLPSGFTDKLETGAMAAGAFMNTKHASDTDRRNAFRLGFLKTAAEIGMLKQSAVMLAITPESLLAVPRGLAGLGRGAAERAGSVFGAATIDPNSDDLTELEAEELLLKEQLEQARMLRDQRKIRRALASGKSAR